MAQKPTFFEPLEEFLLLGLHVLGVDDHLRDVEARPHAGSPQNPSLQHGDRVGCEPVAKHGLEYNRNIQATCDSLHYLITQGT